MSTQGGSSSSMQPGSGLSPPHKAAAEWDVPNLLYHVMRKRTAIISLVSPCISKKRIAGSEILGSSHKVASFGGEFIRTRTWSLTRFCPITPQRETTHIFRKDEPGRIQGEASTVNTSLAGLMHFAPRHQGHHNGSQRSW